MHYYNIANVLTRPSGIEKKKVVSVGVFVTAIVVIFPRVFINGLSGTSLVDNGWSWALQFFFTHLRHYQWGKDLVYTYGPLSFLSTRSVPAGYYAALFLFDFYIVSIFSVIFVLLYRTTQSYKGILLFGVALLFGMWEVNFLMQVFNLLALSIMLEKKKYYWLSFFILLNVVLSLYIKLNSLLFSFISLSLLFLLLAARKKYITLVLVIAIFFALNGFLLNLLNVSLKDYLITSFQSVKYYSYSQYNFNPAYKPILGYGIAITLLSLGLSLYLTVFKLGFRKDFIKILLIGNIALLMFLLFKQGFTRLDRGHYNEFLCFFPLVLYVLYLNCSSHRKMIEPFIGLSILANFFFSSFVFLKHYDENIPLFSGQPPLFTYCSQLLGPHPAKSGYDGAGKGSYDYYSNQCIYQRDNPNPNWHNRPAFQSIVAVSPYLDSINSAYYQGANAPDTIFYDNLSTDDRNPLWDDPQCKWAIFSHYQYRYTDRLHQLVLTRRPAPLRVKDVLLLDTTIAPGQVVQIPGHEKGIITMSSHVNYTSLGNIRTFLFQSPHISLSLRHPNTAPGSGPDSVRFIPALFNDQRLILNYSLSANNSGIPGYNNELTRDLLQGFNSIKPNVRAFCFQTDMPAGIGKRIRVKLYATSLID
ncbi:MAG: hypothetical protein P4L51_10730 [Puia sp.]|nr:hypothetical protein [Puia sp.]